MSNKNKKGENDKPVVAGSKADWEAGSPAALNIDWRVYEEYLEDESLSEDQRQEFLEGLWHIIVSFVDMGFELHPVQQVGGEELEIAKFLATDSSDVVGSTKSSPQEIITNTPDGESKPSNKRSRT